ncbi:TetR/AcrR family transcriptional regulator [Nocardioides sp.]|uniref:TetR/AcrR family transcriptional regulator n=1 Tax=Nocardioides sp. TaxID=35761 RepID=UPI0035296C24
MKRDATGTDHPPSRVETQARTRAALLAAARECFLERGFHDASVGEIARRAGYTTGALYSNFGGKDDLFLAMLDEHLVDRAQSQRHRMAEGATFEEAVRAAARDLHRAGEREPGMTPLTVEFWTYAASRPELRERARALQARQIEWIADLVRGVCERHGVRPG